MELTPYTIGTDDLSPVYAEDLKTVITLVDGELA